MLDQPHPVDVNLVLYHQDLDGFAAAWAAWKLLGNTATYLPVQYGDTAPDVTTKNVAVLDFAYTGADLETMLKQANSLVMLDHHKSLTKTFPDGHDNLISNLSASGAVMAWNWFHPGVPTPQALLFVQDYDLWLFTLPNTRSFQQGVSHIPWKEEHLDDLDRAFSNLDQVIHDGRVLCRYIDAQVARDVKKAALATLLPVSQKVWVFNGHNPWYSESAHAIAEQNPEVDVCLIWTYLGRDGTILCSLRSTETDVSAWAAKLGGGGHKNAAGFVWKGSIDSLFQLCL